MTQRHILLLGGTGLSGIEFIKHALKQPTPPLLTLLVRKGSKSKLPTEALEHGSVKIVEGALDDIATLNQALAVPEDTNQPSVTVVISFLGAYMALKPIITRDKSHPIANAFESTILPAMKSNGVSRIIALSTPTGCYSSAEAKSITWKWWFYTWMPALLAPQGNAEMAGIANAIISAGHNDKDLEWTVFRVPHLTQGGTPTTQVLAGHLDREFAGSLDLARSSLARWVWTELDEKAWLRATPLLANP
ncbi:hypothetical protein B0A52_02911 [Exophiala mesophila]|uniref:NAD(P)-binding domain-containing protein n=1 Tax=Exophiala mesophila TaxID=212818 RepID=A0A438NBW0_EXOME|nr:hypothetical protein B0A52_02911 [Exophiala mesophila]